MKAHAAAAGLVRARLSIYAELSKIRISTMVAVTTAAAFVVAPRPFDFALCICTVVGTMAVSSAAGALNQIVERDLDALMRRTERRPLPSRRISEGEATAFALGAAIGGVALLWFFVNALTAVLSLGCLLFYVAVYTPLKTRTTWNTVVGAVAGAVPPVLGWTGATGRLDPPALALFGILLFWQLPHFFAIAHLYRDDYASAGFRMLPVVDVTGARTAVETLLFTAALVAVSLSPWALGLSGPWYLAGALVIGAAFLACAVRMAAARGARREARRVLLASVVYLPVLLGLLVLDRARA